MCMSSQQSGDGAATVQENNCARDESSVAYELING